MKKILILGILLSMITRLIAVNIDTTTAKLVAYHFMKNKIEGTRSISQNEAVIHYTKSLNENDMFYIVNFSSKAFVILSADTRIMPVLGYSTEFSFNKLNIPPDLEYLFTIYASQIDCIKSSNGGGDEFNVQLWNNLMSSPKLPLSPTNAVPNLLTIDGMEIKWYQESELYNLFCPLSHLSSTDHVPVGCVATAIGQVMRKWSCPLKGAGSNTYTDGDNSCGDLPDDPSYGVISEAFDVSYDWFNMPNILQYTSPQIEKDAVSLLLYHIGVSAEMDYAHCGSGVETPNAVQPLIDHFHYSPNAEFKSRIFHPSSWDEMVKSELNEGRPLVYRGKDIDLWPPWNPTSDGHAWVVAGYDDNFNGELHYYINWGWGGCSNGYYLLDNLNPDNCNNAYNFNDLQGAIFGIKPEETIPTVQITSPINYAMVAGIVNINAIADDIAGIYKVEFYANNTFLSADLSSPYTVPWNSTTVPNGTHFIKAKAYDNAGNTAENIITVTVDNTISQLYNGQVNPSQGNTSTNFQFSVYFKDSQAPQYVKTIGTGWTLNMTGSGNYSSGVQFTANNTFSTPGNYTYYFEAKTASNEILRYPASGFLSLNVSQNAAGWDIAVISFGTYYTPSNIQPGTVITVNAKVENFSISGNTYTNVPLKAELFDPSGNKLTESNTTIPSLASGVFQNFPMTLTMPSNAGNGSYQILVTVFPLLDNDPSNNSVSLNVYVGAVATNEQYAVPYGLEVIYLGGHVHIPPGENNPSYVLYSMSDQYCTFFDPSNTSSKIYKEHNKLWTSNGATIAVEEIDNTGSDLALIRPGNAVTNGPDFPVKTILTYPGQNVSFMANAPNGRYFSGDVDDYPVYKPGTNSNPNLVRDWQTGVVRSNGNSTVSISFAVPSGALIDNYIFYQTTAYTTTNAPREHMTRLEIIVNNPPPQINSLSSYFFSADDQLTITGTNFGTSQATVKFYNNLNATILSWSNTQITCRVPNGVQSGNVFVINSSGTSNGKSYTINSSTGDPFVVQPIPDQEMMQGEILAVATLSNVFSDPNNDPLVYTATSSSPDITTSINSGVLSIETTSTAAGQAQIVVSATDLDNATVQDEFTVNVIIPELTVVPESLIFGEVLTGMNSTPQSYSISGSNLISDILISAPSGFDVSFESGNGYSNSLILPNNDGTVNSTTIFARFSPTTPGSYSGSISNITAGATIQNVDVSGTGIVLPVITITPSTLAFGNIAVGSHSLAQPYVVTGSNLTESITVTAPDGFDVSATGNDPWASSISIPQTDGNVNTLVYIRFSPTESIEYSGNITNASTGATTQNVAVSGTGINSTSIISTSVESISGVFYQYLNSPPLEYMVSASNLSSDLLITAETDIAPYYLNGGILISRFPETGYTTEIALFPDQGNIESTVIYIKVPSGFYDLGQYVGTITHTSNNISNNTLPVEIECTYPTTRNAPIATLGNILAEPESTVYVPLTVVDFEYIMDANYVIDFNPQVLTFQGLTNFNEQLFPICQEFDVIPVSSNLTRLNIWRLYCSMDYWCSISDGEKLFDLVFTYHSGISDLTFQDGNYLLPWMGNVGYIDEPFSEYYINGYIGPSTAPPVISNSMNGVLSAAYSQMITPATSYQVNATNLVGDLIIVANTQSSTPGNCQLEISLSPDQGFSTQLNLTPVDGSIDTTIYVKPGCDAVPVYCAGIITQSSNGAMNDIINVDLDNLYFFQYAPVVTLGDVQSLPGSLVYVPMTANSFNNIGVAEFYIDFDPNVLTYSGIENAHQSLPYYSICNNCGNPSTCCFDPNDYILSNVTSIGPNINRLYIRIKFEVLQFAVPDGEKVLDIVFNYSEGYSNLIFADGYYYFSGNSGSPFDPEIINEPFENYYFNGSVGLEYRTLSLELNLEGLFNPTVGTMNTARGRNFSETIADEITLHLAHDTFPYSIVYEIDSILLDRTGHCQVEIPGNLIGDYYIVITHRNSIETWAKIPVSFNQDTINYNFSDYISKAYNNNLILVGSKYCIYAGDVNQDGFVDTGDMSSVDNDASGFTTGYIPTDVNGDHIVDTGDITFVDNNSSAFVGADYPTSDIPEVITSDIINITHESAISGGEVISQGSSPVTSRGVCWSLSPNPTIFDSHTPNGSGTGSFICSISGLSPGNTYHVCAYATNSETTSYGDDISFVTPLFIPGNGVIDIDSNVYTSVILGTQEWMVENLRVTHYQNGNEISNITDNTQWCNLVTGAWCWYNNDIQYNNPYGKLYNYYAVSDLRQLCPENWHVPTHQDFIELREFLGGENIAGGKLKEIGNSHWNFPNTGATNESGFTAVPSGTRTGNDGPFYYLGEDGHYWSATFVNTHAYHWYTYFNTASFSSSSTLKTTGYAVRCLKD